MSLESSEVVVAGTGHLYRATVGTAFPTNISTAVDDTLWAELGYTSEDGVTFQFDRTTQEIMGWQSRDPLREIETATPRQITAELLQMNQNTWNTAMGGGTWSTPTPGNYLYVPPTPGTVDQFAYIVEAIDGSNKYRWCFRKVQNITGYSMKLSRSDAMRLPLTVKVLAADNGANAFDFQTNDANLGDATQAGS